MIEGKNKQRFWPAFSVFTAALVVLLMILPLLFNKVVISGRAKIPYGAYGLPLAQAPVSPPGTRTVILLGNSVWQTTDVVDHMVTQAQEQQLGIQFSNFSLSGSSIFDLLLLASIVIKQRPDLLVFHLNPCSFGCAMPIYRTTVKDFIMGPADWELLRHPAVWGSLTAEELAFSFVSSGLSGIRFLDILRIMAKQGPRSFLARWGLPQVMEFFPFQVVFAGLGENEMLKSKKLFLASTEVYLHAEAALKLLLSFLIDKKQRALFIEQENDLQKNHISESYQDLFKDKEGIFFSDHRQFFQNNNFRDEFHPQKEFTAEIARRTLSQIRQALR